MQVPIEGINIERVNVNKYFGVSMDEKIAISMSRLNSLSVLATAQHILAQRSPHILYCPQVLPIILHVGFSWTQINYYYYVKLKLFHLVEFKTAQITYRAKNSLPPGNCWKMFFEREVGYNLREKLILKTLCSYNKEKQRNCGTDWTWSWSYDQTWWFY